MRHRYSVPDEALLDLRKSIRNTEQLKKNMATTTKTVESVRPLETEFVSYLQNNLFESEADSAAVNDQLPQLLDRYCTQLTTDPHFVENMKTRYDEFQVE